MTATTCWILVEAGSDEPLDDDGVPHFDSYDEAAETVAKVAANYEPRQLGKPCLIMRCRCCGELYEDSDMTHSEVHFETVEEAERAAANTPWTVHPDGTFTCEDCTSGECGCPADDIAVSLAGSPS